MQVCRLVQGIVPGMITVAVFAWHFRYLETHLPFWYYLEPTRWRLYEALALVPIAIGLNWLFRERRLGAWLVLAGFWAFVAGPFDVKLIELNAPLLPSDITLIFKQYGSLRVREQVALALWLIVGVGVCGAIGLQWRRSSGRTRLVVAGTTLLSVGGLSLLIMQTVNEKFTLQNQRILATKRGHLVVYGVEAALKFLERAPSRDDVANAQRALRDNPLLKLAGEPLPTPAWGPPVKPGASLYVVLVESWIDPLDLGFTYSEDPFPPRLRQWISASRSRLLTSISRGGTASTEFEVMFGMPAQVLKNGYGREFREYVRQPMMGLAAQLRQAGIPADLQSASAVDYYGEYSAYRCAGFEDITLGHGFDRSDLDGWYLADESFFDQSLRRLSAKPGPRRPALHGLTTMASHYPFSLNPKVRPPFITTTPRQPGVEALANRMAYTSRALMDLIDRLKKQDPGASIVVFGDHSPQPDKELQATPYYNEADTVFSAPLLWLDELDKPIKLGRVPAYGLHYMILQHFGLRPAAWAVPFAQAARNELRNYAEIGRFSLRSPGAETQWCPDPFSLNNGCTYGSDFFKQVRVIEFDLLSGAQHGLKDLTRQAHR
jgi:hypothetical protein